MLRNLSGSGRLLKDSWLKTSLFSQQFSSGVASQPESSSTSHPSSQFIQTTKLQRALLMMGSGVMSFLNPARDDMIAIFGETSAQCALDHMVSVMKSSSSGQRLLSDQPRIRSNTVDLDKLRKLPEDTLGFAYTLFLDYYNYSPDARRPVQFLSPKENAEHWYVMQRYREVHDLNHVLLGQGTDILGEVVVKWVEAAQTRLPLCYTGGLSGSLRLRPKQRERYITTHLPYALRVCRESSNFMAFYFEENWELSMDEVRQVLHLEPPPETPVWMKKPATS